MHEIDHATNARVKHIFFETFRNKQNKTNEENKTKQNSKTNKQKTLYQKVIFFKGRVGNLSGKRIIKWIDEINVSNFTTFSSNLKV